MTDAEMKSLLLIAFLAKSGRFFDDVGGDGGETAVNGAD